MGNVYMEADQVRFKDSTYRDVQAALAAALEGGGGGGTTVVANPEGSATADLSKLQVGDNIYGIPAEAGDISYDNTSSGLLADDVQAAIDELDADLSDIPDVTGNPDESATAGNLTKLKIGSAIYDVPSGGSVPTSMSYITTGLTYTNCSYVSGGYFTIGNAVFLNIRVKCTDSTAVTMSISGLPTYNSKTANLKNIVPVYGYNMTGETSDYLYGAIGSAGILGVKATSLTADTEYTLSCFYLKD